MKKLIITILMSALILASYAQEGRSNIDKIEHLKAQKVAFMTEKIGLSTSDAQRFWPVYNEYSAKKDSLHHTRVKERMAMNKDLDKLSDKAKTESLDKQKALQWEEDKLDKYYYNEFKKILTIDQVIKLYDAEYEFRMRLIRQIKEKKEASKREGKMPVS